jgi:uncharacterized phage protein (predicted DNA packaging)
VKLSEIPISTVKDHCGISGADSDGLIEIYIAAAKKQISDYTGHSIEDLDNYEDIPYAFLAIVCEMYSYRTMTVDVDKLNPMAAQIMNMHCVNLLS